MTLETGLLTDKDTAEKSKSKFMWNLTYRRKGIDATYTAHGLDDEAALETFLKKGRANPNVIGYNVTKGRPPFKEVVIKYLDSLDRSAREVGAVNVIKREKGRLVGYNTDGLGFIRSLRRYNVNPNGLKVVLLGAGGAAKAIAYALAHEGVTKLDIHNRTREKAEKLSKDMRRRGFKIVRGYGLVEAELQESLLVADLVVQATDVGMKGEKEKEKVIDGKMMTLTPAHCVFVDIVYTPLITPFLGDARAIGRKIGTGDWMLVEQFAYGFKILHGIELTEEDLIAAHREAGFQ